MKKTWTLNVNQEDLTQDSLNALIELEQKGFIVNGQIEFDTSDATTVMGILNRVINIELNKVRK